MVRIGDGGRVGEETWADVRAQFDDVEIAGLRKPRWHTAVRPPYV
jgi:hypothetical protein